MLEQSMNHSSLTRRQHFFISTSSFSVPDFKPSHLLALNECTTDQILEVCHMTIIGYVYSLQWLAYGRELHMYIGVPL